MTEREELEARAAVIEAELESRKSASEKAADMLLDPKPRPARKGWERSNLVGTTLRPAPKPIVPGRDRA